VRERTSGHGQRVKHSTSVAGVGGAYVASQHSRRGVPAPGIAGSAAMAAMAAMAT